MNQEQQIDRNEHVMRRRCSCSWEDGPCELHGTYLVVREGASTRTADDLLMRRVQPSEAPAHMLGEGDAFGTFCPHDGTLATRTDDGVTRIDPHCAWKGHRDDIVAALDTIAGGGK